MNDGSGATLPPLLGEWTHRPECSCLRTSLGCCLQTAGTLWPRSLKDWPRSAMWDATGLRQLPASELVTSDNASSSLLNTPRAARGFTSENARPDPDTELGKEDSTSAPTYSYYQPHLPETGEDDPATPRVTETPSP